MYEFVLSCQCRPWQGLFVSNWALASQRYVLIFELLSCTGFESKPLCLNQALCLKRVCKPCLSDSYLFFKILFCYESSSRKIDLNLRHFRNEQTFYHISKIYPVSRYYQFLYLRSDVFIALQQYGSKVYTASTVCNQASVTWRGPVNKCLVVLLHLNLKMLYMYRMTRYRRTWWHPTFRWCRVVSLSP